MQCSAARKALRSRTFISGFRLAAATPRRLVQLPTVHRLCSTHSKPKGTKANQPARTRFAPSPTGYLHLGSLRTALFSYLLAKKTGGSFILRIEDTDKKRTVEGAEEKIFEALRWAGLQWDEGPEVGGEYGPYRQSERRELHESHALKLVESGHAYRCFCPPERLKSLATRNAKLSLPTDYDRACADIPVDEAKERASKGEKHVIRLKMPDLMPTYNDVVYGTIATGIDKHRMRIGAYEDPVLLKSDGMPTYHLANVVDDHFMKITHVLRATEWMPSTPKHVHLYQAFGWEPPVFAHVGLLQDKNRSKLSKRSGDVDVAEYKAKGYLPEALVNFVALLGWSHSRGSDIMSLSDMVQEFDLKRLTSGNAIVTFEKLNFLQRNYIQQRVEKNDYAGTLQALYTLALEKFGSVRLAEGSCPAEEISKDFIADLFVKNLKNYAIHDQFLDDSDYFFVHPNMSSKAAVKALRKILQEGNLVGGAEKVKDSITSGLEQLSAKDWTYSNLEKVIANAGFTSDDPKDSIYKIRILRWALSGGKHGPNIYDMLLLLGRERSLHRLKSASLEAEGSN